MLSLHTCTQNAEIQVTKILDNWQFEKILHELPYYYLKIFHENFNIYLPTFVNRNFVYTQVYVYMYTQKHKCVNKKKEFPWI